eukprot:CAMPEP_0202922060 /NCGR_PEP_ID=MMETSP1392-20130828/77724_1 /ASSEMBLY_ACC=CAM_ASM_000868 /TAXON_ID=225041 /ORGANISM="Chlamydomonas chlamydogama, Strain SAG 11-48b" /LENGTH=632 /DNA_ID=CAMNT_0049615667 /DNA_START=305 /DNA_END=2204 /DNA_ORIENTATION=+
MWDVGGCDKIRPLWRHYFVNTQGLVFFVDSNDRDRICEVKDELHRLLAEDELRDAAVLIIANKQDLANAMSLSEVEAALGVNAVRDNRAHIPHPIHVVGCTMEKPQLFRDAMERFSKRMLEVKRNTPAREVQAQVREDPDDLLSRWLQVEDEPDELFLSSLEDYSLQSWDHRTHLRIAWLMLTKYGRKEGMQRIFARIRAFIENSPRTKRGSGRGTTFHETLTYFWTHMVHYAIESTNNRAGDFKTFLLLNPQLTNGGLHLPRGVPSLPGGLQPTELGPPHTPACCLADAEQVWQEGGHAAHLLRHQGLHREQPAHQAGQREGHHISRDAHFLLDPMVHYAMASTKNHAGDFKTFLLLNPQLTNGGLHLHYYTKRLIMDTPEARSSVVLPDKVPLPSLLPRQAQHHQADPQQARTLTADLKALEQSAGPKRPVSSLTDVEFVVLFERRGLPSWGHEHMLRLIYAYLGQLGRRRAVSLPSWGHEHMLRLIYAYLGQLGRRRAVDKIMQELRALQGDGFSTTITYFWIQLVTATLVDNYSAVVLGQGHQATEQAQHGSQQPADASAPPAAGTAPAHLPDFPSLLAAGGYASTRMQELIGDPQRYLRHYSKTVIFSDEASRQFVPPDKKPLPSVM